MRFTLLSALPLLCSVSFALGLPLFSKRAGTVDYYDPRNGGGSLLNQSGGPGLGEPLNVIISGKSSSDVLTKDGFLNYVRAVGYSMECFGQHQGARQPANLGDGNGARDEREVLREHFNIPILGTCLQSLTGGNHMRTYVQDGPNANSGALFLAVSQEKDLADHHAIVPDGYNIGRDKFVSEAVGEKKLGFPFFRKYTTTVQDITGLMAPGAQGVNHGIATDGVVKLLTVTSKFSF